jgi:two-component system chemotaxis response regulator CheB
MQKIKTLIVDNCEVNRRAVAEILSKSQDFAVHGVARHGRDALRKVDMDRPDLIITDLDMPVMDGVEMLQALRQRDPELPVVVFSRQRHKGAAATVQALINGANGFVRRPEEGEGSIRDKVVARMLLDKARDCVGGLRRGLDSSGAPPRVAPPPGAEAQAPRAQAPRAQGPGAQATPAQRADRQRGAVPRCAMRAVGIGVSTGGPDALSELLPSIPGDLHVPVFIVQHMPPMFTKSLAERLNRITDARVKEGEDGEQPEAGSIYLAPGGWHMVVQRRPDNGLVIRLNEEEPENHCRPAVDVLFRSLAGLYGPEVLAVVLTGMGRDGLEGCRVIAAQGGTVYVQSQQTCTVWGMPRAVYEAGLHHKEIDLQDMGHTILQAVRYRH